MMLDAQEQLRIKVFAMEIVESEPPSRLGTQILARFSVSVSGVEICGCALAWAPDARLALLPPSLGRPGTTNRVRFSDAGTREAIRNEAVRVYRAVTGGELPGFQPVVSSGELRSSSAR